MKVIQITNPIHSSVLSSSEKHGQKQHVYFMLETRNRPEQTRIYCNTEKCKSICNPKEDYKLCLLFVGELFLPFFMTFFIQSSFIQSQQKSFNVIQNT